MSEDNWSNSDKRAGVYFKHPELGSMWEQEHKDVNAVLLRKAIELTWKYYTKTYKRLEAQAKETGK